MHTLHLILFIQKHLSVLLTWQKFMIGVLLLIFSEQWEPCNRIIQHATPIQQLIDALDRVG